MHERRSVPLPHSSVFTEGSHWSPSRSVVRARAFSAVCLPRVRVRSAPRPLSPARTHIPVSRGSCTNGTRRSPRKGSGTPRTHPNTRADRCSGVSPGRGSSPLQGWSGGRLAGEQVRHAAPRGRAVQVLRAARTHQKQLHCIPRSLSLSDIPRGTHTYHVLRALAVVAHHRRRVRHCPAGEAGGQRQHVPPQAAHLSHTQQSHSLRICTVTPPLPHSHTPPSLRPSTLPSPTPHTLPARAAGRASARASPRAEHQNPASARSPPTSSSFQRSASTRATCAFVHRWPWLRAASYSNRS